MSFKEQRVYYTARNNQTGLADVKANVFRNGSLVASNLSLSEVSSVSAPGIYELIISAANLIAYGGAGNYLIKIDSVSKAAPAQTKLVVTGNDIDDLHAYLVSMDAKLDGIVSTLGGHTTALSAIQSSTSDTNAKVNNGTYGLSAIQAMIAALQNGLANVQNNVSFSASLPAQLVRPSSGTKKYRIPIRVYDNMGNPEDPDADQILVRLEDEEGNDRSNLLSGYTSGPVPAVKDGVGRYHVDVVIAGSTQLEQINAFFQYSETNGAESFTQDQHRTTEIVEDIQASGLAQQATSDLILTDTTDIKPRVSDIQAKINSATYGLAALKAQIDAVLVDVQANGDMLSDAGYGLQALSTALASKASQVSVDNVAADISNNVKGSGFNSATDSLKAISDRLYVGGQAN